MHKNPQQFTLGSMRIKKIGELIKTHQKQFYITALSITKNREMAQDAVHDAIIAVAINSSDIADLKAYLFTCIRHKALHASIKSQKVTELEEFIETQNMNAEERMFADHVVQYMDKLNPQQSQIIAMKIFAGMTFKEIASAQNQSINTVASHYRRGLEKLKEKFNEIWNPRRFRKQVVGFVD